MFAGRFQKLSSILAATASAYFTRLADTRIPEKINELPTFDCRVWQVPNRQEAANTFYWRELDATKNAISMAAHAHFPHKSLHGINGSEKQEMLWSKKGINFNDYPVFFKRGVYAKRVAVRRALDAETLEKIPEDRRPVDGMVTRTEIQEMDWPACNRIANYMALIYGFQDVPQLN